MAELTQEELDLYITHMKHLDKALLYFSESMVPVKSITGLSLAQAHTLAKPATLERRLNYVLPVKKTEAESSATISNPELLQVNNGLNCYLTKGFISTSKDKTSPLKFCIFARDSAQFFRIYDGIDGIVKNRFPQMRALTKQEKDIVEQRIEREEGHYVLASLKRTGYYIPHDRTLLDILIGD